MDSSKDSLRMSSFHKESSKDSPYSIFFELGLYLLELIRDFDFLATKKLFVWHTLFKVNEKETFKIEHKFRLPTDQNKVLVDIWFRASCQDLVYLGKRLCFLIFLIWLFDYVICHFLELGLYLLELIRDLDFFYHQ